MGGKEAGPQTLALPQEGSAACGIKSQLKKMSAEPQNKKSVEEKFCRPNPALQALQFFSQQSIFIRVLIITGTHGVLQGTALKGRQLYSTSLAWQPVRGTPRRSLLMSASGGSPEGAATLLDLLSIATP